MMKLVLLTQLIWSQNYMQKKEFKKPSEQEIKNMLTPKQYEVTQKDGTEAPFQNEYWDEKRKGIYVDVVTGEPLFSSEDKYDSGSGWPSFTKPIGDTSLVEKKDYKIGVERTEIRSVTGNSHLGHVFKDGPGKDGNRFCINSSAMKFIPYENMDKEGYGAFKKYFKNDDFK